MAKFLSGLLIFLLTFAIGWSAAGYYYLSIPIEQQLAKWEWQPPLPDNVADQTKAEIITLLLSTEKKSKYTNRWDRIPCLDVPEDIFKMLPKRVNSYAIRNCATLRSPEVHIDRDSFDGWRRGGDLLSVTWSTKFYGGNIGGCSYKFALIDNRWKQISADCFAMAS